MTKSTSKHIELVDKNNELETKLAEAYKRIEKLEMDCEELLKTQDSYVLKVEHSLKVANEDSVKLNKVLNKNRKKFEKEKVLVTNDHQAEIEIWRKDLGYNCDYCKCNNLMDEPNDAVER